MILNKLELVEAVEALECPECILHQCSIHGVAVVMDILPNTQSVEDLTRKDLHSVADHLWLRYLRPKLVLAAGYILSSSHELRRRAQALLGAMNWVQGNRYIESDSQFVEVSHRAIISLALDCVDPVPESEYVIYDTALTLKSAFPSYALEELAEVVKRMGPEIHPLSVDGMGLALEILRTHARDIQ